VKYLGASAVVFLMVGIGKLIWPNPPLLNIILMISGSMGLGYILGAIAEKEDYNGS